MSEWDRVRNRVKREGQRTLDRVSDNLGENANDTFDRIEDLFKNPGDTFRHYRDNPKDLYNAYADGVRSLADPFGWAEGLGGNDPTDATTFKNPLAPTRGQVQAGMLKNYLDVIRKRAGLGSPLGGDMTAEKDPDTISASQTLFGISNQADMGAAKKGLF